jgi:hypothetical protein
MFAKQRSFHLRSMGEVRSAQQKCTRRGMLEGVILLNLEHLLTTPDYSFAALKRMQVIAAEDIGAASPDLCRMLLSLEGQWKTLGQREKARRLIQGAMLMLEGDASRFVPCWAVILIDGVVAARSHWLAEDVLLDQLDQLLDQRDLQGAGLMIEEIFLRHPIEDEQPLPEPIGLPRGVMSRVWDVIQAHAAWNQQPQLQAWRTLFGPPSAESITSRLFLYLSLVCTLLTPPSPRLLLPQISDEAVDAWLERARKESFPIPDWMMDKHTLQGMRAGRGQQQFLTEAVQLTKPSAVLGAEREQTTYHQAVEIYLREERHFGRESRTQHIRARWRINALKALHGAITHTPPASQHQAHQEPSKKKPSFKERTALPPEPVSAPLPQIPPQWIDPHCLDDEAQAFLRADPALVAQKCTGTKKKPVFLMRSHVVKGPWRWPADGFRLLRELGRSALMRFWARPDHPCPVLQPKLWPDAAQLGDFYLVTPALYTTTPEQWVIETQSASVSEVGPRTLRVVSRPSVGVLRVSDYMHNDDSYLMSHPEVLEHLIHRALLLCGDSGLHNMIVSARHQAVAVGIDLDENRGQFELPQDWIGCLFKAPPARALVPLLDAARQKHQAWLSEMWNQLYPKLNSDQTHSLIQAHGLSPLTQDLLARAKHLEQVMLIPHR